MSDHEGAGGEIEVTVGETFTIALYANPTTGYVWEPRFDREFLQLQHKDFLQSSDRIGAGGREMFRFVGLRRGSTIIEMAYRRPWEERPLKNRSFSVIVR